MKSRGPVAGLNHLERIYDAAFDDGALNALTRDLANEFGARSSLMHWVHQDGCTAVLADSGYFSAEQLGRYAREFAAIDPWTQATCSPALANRVTILEELIPVEAFIRSEFYEEYIAAMGDNTCRLLGVRLESAWGMGFIGLQRGADQKRFEGFDADGFAEYAPHLLRMLSIRGRLGTIEQSRGNLAAALDARGEAMWLLDSDARVLEHNRAAAQVLARNDGLAIREGRVDASARGVQQKLLAAIQGAARGMGATAVSIPCASGIVQLTLTSIADQNCQRRVLAIAPARSVDDPTLLPRLKALFGLSDAEGRIAIALSDGRSLCDIARERGSAEATVRHQVKTIAAKLGCSRQSEIVATVLRLPRLH